MATIYNEIEGLSDKNKISEGLDRMDALIEEGDEIISTLDVQDENFYEDLEQIYEELIKKAEELQLS